MPSKVADFEVLAEIAAGKRGRIYKALEPITQRKVALRVLDSSTPNLAAIQKSLRAATALCSPNIVAVHEVRQDNGSLVAMMEYAEGRLLRTLMSQEGTFGRGDLIDFARQIGMAIDHATSRGIVHQNLHPANIMQEWDGALKVMDYGLGANPHTLEALRYISPEQASGQKIDSRSNLFSLAAILYEAATGKKSFEGDTPDAILASIRLASFIPPQQAKQDLHPGICAVIAKALSLKPEERYQSGAELVRELENCTKPALPKVAEAPKPAPQPRAPEFTVSASPAPVRPIERPLAPAAVKAQPATTAFPKPAPQQSPYAAGPASGQDFVPAQVPAKPTPIAQRSPSSAPAAAAPTIAPVKAPPKPTSPNKDFFVVESRTNAAPGTTQPTPASPKPVAKRKPQPAADPFALFKSKKAIIGAGALLTLALLLLAVSLIRHRPAEPETAPPVAQTVAPEPVVPAPVEVAEPAPEAQSADDSSLTLAAPRGKKSKKTIAAPAQPVINTGEIIVESTPNGAAVQIDGRSIGVTPLSISQVSSGQHVVTVSLANHEPTSRTVDVSAGNKLRVILQLPELAATVAINSVPQGASILLNGKDTGRITPASMQLQRGHYSLELRKPGFIESGSVFDVSPGENIRLAPQLVAMGNAEDMKEGGKLKRLFGKGGTDGMVKIRIRTYPKGAQIVFNQRRLNKTSPTEVFAPPGIYDVTISLPGYQTLQKRITVTSTDLTLDETLQQ